MILPSGPIWSASVTEPREYNISVRRGVFDGELLFEARVRELPDVAEYAETCPAAYALALDTIETTASIFSESGRQMPAPHVPTDDYSGRVTLRLPRSLHRSLSEAAADERVSLHQHIVSVLGYACGHNTANNSGHPAPSRLIAQTRAPQQRAPAGNG